jgi:hypothetical protein
MAERAILRSLRPFPREFHHDHGQRCAWEQHGYALDREETGFTGRAIGSASATTSMLAFGARSAKVMRWPRQ